MRMTPYADVSGNSGVAEYQISSDFIRVRFKNSMWIYKYTYECPGKDEVEQMKELAERGEGLSTYISQNEKVRNGYAKKEEMVR